MSDRDDEEIPASDDLLAQADLAEEIARRLEAGEPLTGRDLGDNPDRAGAIWQLLPTLRTMVAFGDEIAREEGSRTRSRKLKKLHVIIIGHDPRRRGDRPMKLTFLSCRCYAGAALAVLSVSLPLLAGCSGGEGSQGSEENAATAANLGFTKSETLALRKAGAGRKDLEKAIMKKKIEQLKEQGIDVQIVSPGKKTKGRG